MSSLITNSPKGSAALSSPNLPNAFAAAN